MTTGPSRDPEAERATPMARWTWLALLALLFSLHLASAGWLLADRSPGTDAALSGLPLDDAWIHRVYSRGIARHGTPQYNDGAVENGFTR